MQQTRQPVPLIGAKRVGFRYNRRDIQFDEPFEAVSPDDAEILVKAKLARRPAPPQPAARDRDVDTAALGDDRSRIVTRDAGIPAPGPTVLERKETAAVIVPDNVASSAHRVPELGGTAPKKKRVRSKPKAKAKPPTEPPAAQS